MDFVSTVLQNIRIGWWVAILWFIGFNGTGLLLKKRAKYLPDNWLTAVDKKIPFFPYGFDIIYIVGYVFPFYPILVIQDRTLAWMVIFSYALTLMISFLVYVIYPVKMKQHTHDPKTPLVKFIYRTGPNSNCLPSMHCAFATLPFLMALFAGWPEWPIVGLIGLGVIASTLLLKHHWFIDCVTGIAVAVFSFGFMYGLFYLV